MRRLVLDGVPPSEAALIVRSRPVSRAALGHDGAVGGTTGRTALSRDGAGHAALRPDGVGYDREPAPGARPGTGTYGGEQNLIQTLPGADGRLAGIPTARTEYDPTRTERIGRVAPGGQALALPGAAPEVRGLTRAAMALDAPGTRAALEQAIARHGVVDSWETLLCPVLGAIGRRWAIFGRGIEVEHLLTEIATSVFRSSASSPEPANGRPVLLACAPGEEHSLPLSALAAALAERHLGVRLLGGGLPAAALSTAIRRIGPAVVLVWAQLPLTADPAVLDGLPRLRPPVTILAGGSGWLTADLPPRATYVPDLMTAVMLIRRAAGP